MALQNVKVEITNLNRSYKLNEAFIKKITGKVLSRVKTPRKKIELEFIFLDDKKIRFLNKRYKKRDAPTDVLSFDLDMDEVNPGHFLGEIYISSDTAFRNSRVFNTDLGRELALYIIHGILHLFGYDDEKAPDRARMWRAQERILEWLCGNENLSKVLMPR